MMATSTVAPATHRIPTNEWASGDVTPDVETVLRGHSVVYIGTAGSGNPRCFTVPDIGTLSYPDADGFSAAAATPHVSRHLLALTSEPAFANSYRFLSSGWVQWHAKPVPQHDFGMPPSAASTGHTFTLVIAADKPNRTAIELHPIIQEFAVGVNGIQPSDAVVVMAARIVQAAIARTTEPEFSVDDDGAFSIDLRLSGGLRLLAELPIDGTLDVGVYDDRDANQRAREVEYLPSATAEELIALL